MHRAPFFVALLRQAEDKYFCRNLLLLQGQHNYEWPRHNKGL